MKIQDCLSYVNTKKYMSSGMSHLKRMDKTYSVLFSPKASNPTKAYSLLRISTITIHHSGLSLDPPPMVFVPYKTLFLTWTFKPL